MHAIAGTRGAAASRRLRRCRSSRPEFRLPRSPPRRSGSASSRLRGADPASIPFELPTKSELVVNRRTAAAIGVKLPAELLLRADRVID